MREIKFRAWDKEKKEWVGAETGGVMDLEYSGEVGAFMFDNDSFDIPKNVIWCQFTGLKDKNGKEICEGDIVRRVYAFTKANKPKETTDQIVFSDEWGAFAFHSKTNIGKGWSRMYSGHKAFPFEVIGNIYENPELLKV